MVEYAGSHQFENMVLLQATSPLTTAGDIGLAIEQFEQTGADSLLSVVPQTRFVWSVDTSGQAQPGNYDPAARPRRQDCSAFFVENGAIYISRRSGLLAKRCRLFGRMAAYVMDERTFVELDEPSDVPIIEALLRTRTHGSDGVVTRAKRLKLILTDVDGVLTDAGMYYSDAGDELKKFNTRDGKAFELLRNAGIQTGIITSEKTKLVERRARKLKVDYVYHGVTDKLATVLALIREAGVRLDEVGYIGDDLGDLSLLQAVGLAACPSDAMLAVESVATFRCRCKGGEGAFREFVEFVLAAKVGSAPQATGLVELPPPVHSAGR
jgi:N-acylneuraminate cytidylyltransferase